MSSTKLLLMLSMTNKSLRGVAVCDDVTDVENEDGVATNIDVATTLPREFVAGRVLVAVLTVVLAIGMISALLQLMVNYSDGATKH